jgi:hypothetical protein
MTFSLRRTTTAADELELTRQHDLVAAPRKGAIDWSGLRPEDYASPELERARVAWRARAVQEFHSLALFTQLSSHVHLLGAPLDWCGAFARMIEDEVRHTDLCLRMCEKLGDDVTPEVREDELHISHDGPLRAHVRELVVAAFCIGETISGRMFRRAHRAATVPLARDVVAAILVDETFHGELGWELGALLMRGIEGAERDALASRLPFLVEHYAGLCLATRGPAWARAEPEAQPAPNFGTLTDAGYARAFFDGMEQDVVPGLEAIGLPEARAAYDALLTRL